MSFKNQGRFNKWQRKSVNGSGSNKKGNHLSENLNGFAAIKEKILNLFGNLKNLIVGLNLIDIPKMLGFIEELINPMCDSIFNGISEKDDFENEKIKFFSRQVQLEKNNKNKENIRYLESFLSSYDIAEDLTLLDFSGFNINEVENSQKSNNMILKHIANQKQANERTSDNYFSERSLLSNNNSRNYINSKNILLNSFLKNNNTNMYHSNKNNKTVLDKEITPEKGLSYFKSANDFKPKNFDYSKIVPYVIGNFLDIPNLDVSFSNIDTSKLIYRGYLTKIQQKALIHDKVFEFQNNDKNDEINELIVNKMITSPQIERNSQSFITTPSGVSSQESFVYERPNNDFSYREQMEEVLRCTLDDFIIRMGFDMYDYN